MIVETMTIAEITKELQKDLAEIMDRPLNRINNDYRKMRRKRKVHKTAIYAVFFEIKSARKNNWLFMLSKPPSEKKFKEVVDVIALSYHYNKEGLRVFRVGFGSKGHAVYNGHFFKRYKERMGLTIVDPIEIVKAFMVNNSNSITRRIPKDGRQFSAGVCRDGIILGEVQGSHEIYKTFISRDLTRPNQNDLEKDILSVLEKNIQNEFLLSHFNATPSELKQVKDTYYSICA